MRYSSSIAALSLGCALLAGCGKQPAVVLASANGGATELVQDAPAKPGPAPVAAPKAEREEGFTFPKDRAGPLLSRLLPPPEKDFGLAERSGVPRRLPGPVGIEEPSLALPPGPVTPPTLPQLRSSPVRPGPLPGEGLQARPRTVPLPGVQDLASGERVRVASIEVNQPTLLPSLNPFAPDRASLDDPTLEASGAAVQAAPPAERTGPAPFLRLNLPHPFENRQNVPGETHPPEEASPPIGPPRLPTAPAR